MKLTQQFFITSDTHFDHEKLLMFGRPDNFGELIVQNWNKVVGKHDFVLHLGDLSLCGKERTQYYTKRLNGTKFLIWGNHDSGSVTWYKDCGFTVVEPIFKRFSDKYDNYTNYLFTHEPVLDMQKGWFNIHGHMHGNMHRGTVPNGEFYYDAGVDANNFTPVKLYDIIQELKCS